MLETLVSKFQSNEFPHFCFCLIYPKKGVGEVNHPEIPKGTGKRETKNKTKQNHQDQERANLGQERDNLVRQNTLRELLCYSSQIPQGKNSGCISTHASKGHMGTLYLFLANYNKVSQTPLSISPASRHVCVRKMSGTLGFSSIPDIKEYPYFCNISKKKTHNEPRSLSCTGGNKLMASFPVGVVSEKT